MIQPTELIQIESELHKKHAEEELESLCLFREEIYGQIKEFNLECAKAYLMGKGYAEQEVKSALENFFKNDIRNRIINHGVTIGWYDQNTLHIGYIDGVRCPDSPIISVIGDIGKDKDLWHVMGLDSLQNRIYIPIMDNEYTLLKGCNNISQLRPEEAHGTIMPMLIQISPKGQSPMPRCFYKQDY